MATETESETKTKTRDQVKAMLDQGMSAKEIAEALGKTPATIYVHIRNLRPEGERRGRGRPPKPKADGETQSKRVAKPMAKSAKSMSNGNGRSAEFPLVKEAIEAELEIARARVIVLEGMMAAVSA